MKITVEKAMNGFIITYPDVLSDENGKDIEITKSSVVEEKEHEFGEQEAFVFLCYDLLDLFGINNSKHNRRRIEIELSGEED
ncbi:MAG TPA: hypothetical protein PKH98_06250 [Candidatus Omnitrophota bacterium]|nr:hypothetical protein [Candidatus Omnitrophota bacterium]